MPKIIILLLLVLFIGVVIWQKQNFQPDSEFISYSNKNIITDFLYPQVKIKNNLTSTPPASLIKDLITITPKPPQSYTGITRSGNELRVPILMYHYIGNNPDPKDLARNTLSVSPDKFEEQLKYLKENSYQTTTLDTLYAALKKTVTLPDKSLILTFDDGYIDFFYNAFPLLQKYNAKATVFIPTGLMGGKAYLTWDQIQQMQRSGLVSFEAHTVHHTNLPTSSSTTIEFEVTESKKTLESKIGVPVNFIAFPYGTSSWSVIEAVKKAGYVGAVGTWPDKIQSEGTIYDMPRLRINQSVDLPAFIQKL